MEAYRLKSFIPSTFQVEFGVQKFGVQIFIAFVHLDE